MKHLILVSLVVHLAMISGCQERSFEVPQTDDPLLIVSHVKERMLTFIDIESKEVLLSEDSLFPLNELISIGDGKIFATSQSEHSLMLYDVREGKSKPFLEINQGLTAIQYDPTTSVLFVADIKNDLVHSIDVEKERLTHSVAVGSYPTDLEIANGQLFVLNGDSNDVTVIDISKQEVVKTFPVLERPSGMYFDGQYLWIGGHGSYGQLNKNVFIYNPKTGEQMQEIELGLMPVAFFGDASSPFLYVLSHGDHTLSKVHKETYEVIDSIEVGQNPNDVNGTEETLFVTNLDGDSVSIIDRTSFELVEELTVPAGPYMILLEE